jgi:hypothetical protein
MNEFFVGWMSAMPPANARWVRRTVALIGSLAAALAVTLVRAQAPFAASAFEFQQYRDFNGAVVLDPYPALLVQESGGGRRYLLVAPGKHGGEELTQRFAGQSVKVHGELIHRDGQQMIQVDGITPAGANATASIPISDDGEQTLAGEIVDSKCFLGVMNPGEGKVHRDCAARCISGGLPPALATPGGELYLLVTADRRPLGRELLSFVGEPVRIRGRVLRGGDTRWLATSTSAIERSAH